MLIVCPHCGKKADKQPNAVNRAKRDGHAIYCSFRCSGLGRRMHKTKAQKKEEKRVYDIEYRKKHDRTAQRAAYHKRTYDPVKAAIERKKRMPHHVQYCRRPEYKRKKQAYDLKRRIAEYGAFGDAWRVLLDLTNEIKSRTTHEERQREKGTLNKTQERKRQDGVEKARASGRRKGRERPRRDRHSTAYRA